MKMKMKMKNNILCASGFVFLVLCFIFLEVKASAEDKSWEKVRSKGVLTVGLDDAFAPMGFRGQKGEIIGFDVDLAREVSKRLKIKIIFQPCVWSSIFLELKAGNIDVIWNGVSMNPSREKEVLFSQPYLTNRMVIVIAERSRDKIKQRSDLRGKKVAVQAGSPAFDCVNDYKSSLKELIQYPDNNTALLDLTYGGVDAVVLDEVVADYYIAKEKVGLLKLQDAFAKENYGIGFRKKDYALRNKIQQTLNAMRQDGTSSKISMKWFGRDVFGR